LKKILIICGSAEPGKDGVGDYSLKLSNWLNNSGCRSEVLAFSDKYISEQLKESLLTRVPAGLSLKERRKKLQEKIDQYNPDVLFLQYVPYAYHKKGMPLKFARAMGSIKTSAQWFIMIHEPYIGGKLTAKGKFIQFAQQKSLKRLVKRTRPKRVFTSIKKYEKALAEINIVSSILPLFGNISFAEPTNSDSSEKVKGVYFGAPPKKENYHVFTEGLLNAAKNHSLELNLCGKTSNSDFESYLQYSVRNENILLNSLGELPEKDLSELFSRMDFGIARIAPDLIGKSGSAISLLEHGVKLWIPLAKTQGEIDEEVLFRPDICFAQLSDLIQDDSKPERISNLDKVGKLLLNQLDLVA
jgi:hypothetical protein